MSHFAVAGLTHFGPLMAVLIVVAVLVRGCRHRGELPRHRVLRLHIRLRLRLRPGRGHGSLAQLHLRWGRGASYRESKRTRPQLTRLERARAPQLHSAFLGRAQFRHTVRVTVQEHGALIGPPRSLKSALLSRVAQAAPGAVVITSSKRDMFAITSGIRQLRGPVRVFNPDGIGGIPSTVRWSPLDGCRVPSVAIRRADAFAQAASTAGAEDAAFWAGKASDAIRGYFLAAAQDGGDMRRVAQWAAGHRLQDAIELLDGKGLGEWAAQLAELTGPAEKTAATIRMVVSRALSFMNDPVLAASVLPGPGEQFDVDEFLLSGGTLYMIARPNGEDSPLAPLFAALASEIHYRATQLASLMKGGRLDPPLTMILDEVTRICPVPLPAWLADAGGQGVSVWSAFHGVSQLVARWGAPGAQTVLDTSNCKVIYPGLGDSDMLAKLSGLCGEFSAVERVRERDSQRPVVRYTEHPVMTPAMIRQLPKGWALVIRDNYAPVIIRVATGWTSREYRRARRRGALTAALDVPQPLTEAQAAAIAAQLDGVTELRPFLPGGGREAASGDGRRDPWDQRRGGAA